MHRESAHASFHSYIALLHHSDNMFQNQCRDRANATKMSNDFYSRFKIPSVIGVVDGSHIPICKRSVRGQACPYVNRKGWKSILLQGIVNAFGRFVSIDVGEKGSRHDAYVFKTSDIGRWLESNEAEECLVKGHHFVLGDGAYTLRWYMMKTFDKRAVIPEEFKPTFKRINSKINSKCQS